MTFPIESTGLPRSGGVDAAAPVAAAADSAEAAAFRSRATEAAEKFEGFFIAQMLKQMRSSSREFAADGSPFKDPVNADMLGMVDGLMADQMAGQHAFGIADAILRQLLPAAAAPAAAGTVAEALAAPPQRAQPATEKVPTPLNVAPPAVASSW